MAVLKVLFNLNKEIHKASNQQSSSTQPDLNLKGCNIVNMKMQPCFTTIPITRYKSSFTTTTQSETNPKMPDNKTSKTQKQKSTDFTDLERKVIPLCII